MIKQAARMLTMALALGAAPLAAQQATPATAPLPRVALDTTAGRIVIEADTLHAPITAGNFLKYVDGKRLDGVTFYRTVKVQDRFGFVQFGTNGDPKRVLPPIKHEPTTLTGLHHTEGTISVARFEPGSARGDFTISVGDQSPALDADPSKPGDNLGYAAFGHVVEGMDHIVAILDGPVSPTATVRGSFKGEVPEAAVKVLSARRLP
jgi:peptidyl-prolyl cis-trans isomerase A (cyclophilin A)